MPAGETFFERHCWKDMNQKEVAAGRIIEMKYRLHEGNADGPLMEEMDEQWPLKFLFGSGAMMPVFEENIGALAEGNSFAFRIAAADAYGAHDPGRIHQLFFEDLEENPMYPFDLWDADDLIQLRGKDGVVHAGRVLEKHKQYVVVDCNHALAGKDLWFEGQILFVREARTDELEANRYIEPNGFRSHSTLRKPPNR